MRDVILKKCFQKLVIKSLHLNISHVAYYSGITDQFTQLLIYYMHFFCHRQLSLLCCSLDPIFIFLKRNTAKIWDC